jgi:hypothetical protein
MTFRLVNTIDCTEEQIINFIKQTNGDNFIAGFEGCEEKFKVNSNLIFEVICENKPQDSEGIIWEAIK